MYAFTNWTNESYNYMFIWNCIIPTTLTVEACRLMNKYGTNTSNIIISIFYMRLLSFIWTIVIIIMNNYNINASNLNYIYYHRRIGIELVGFMCFLHVGHGNTMHASHDLEYGVSVFPVLFILKFVTVWERKKNIVHHARSWNLKYIYYIRLYKIALAQYTI